MVKKIGLKIINTILIFAVVFSVGYSLKYIILKSQIFFNAKFQSKSTHDKGYSMLLKTKNNEVVRDVNIYLKKGEDYNYIFEFSNDSDEDSMFELVIDCNYDRIPFLNPDSGEKVLKHKFKVDKKSYVEIPISIDNKTFQFSLNPIIFTMSEVSDKESALNNKSYSVRYDVITEKNEIANLSADSDFKYIENKNTFGGVLINQEFEKVDEYLFPNSKITAQKGELVKIAIRAYSDTDDSLFWLQIDNMRVQFLDSKNYIYFYNVKNSVIYKEIAFNAPEKQGMYSIYGYFALEPLNQYNNNNPGDHLVKTSNKLLLEVK
ncbi:hypothetical protein ACFCP7_22320 [Paenibacillus elgii]